MPNRLTGKKLAVIGSGQMAEALVGGLLEAGVIETAAVWATDASAERRALMAQRYGVRVGADNTDAARWGDLVLLAVKPQVLPPVVDDLAPVLTGKLVMSIAAGVSLQSLSDRIPPGVRLIRVMPNAPAMIREGISAVALGPGVTEEDSQVARTLFEAVGRVVVLDESLMHAVTGLSGSGPAYVSVAIEALADGGVKAGLSRQVAELLAAQTVAGAAKTVLETGEHPARLKDHVASPGGTTIAGLGQLEEGTVRATLISAVEAAARKSEELGKGCS